MASKRSFFDEELTCPICRDFFRDPVILTCAHSICRMCVEQYWEVKEYRACPVCRATSTADGPPIQNLALKNLCASVSRERKRTLADTQQMCSLHNKKVEFFCVDTEDGSCVACKDTATTSNFRPIEELAVHCKEDLNKKLKSLQEKLDGFNKTKKLYVQMAKHIKTQANEVENNIRAAFRSLHSYLEGEQSARISALRREEDWKVRLMAERTETLWRQIAFISENIQCLEEQMEASDASVVLNYSSTLDRVECTLRDPDMVSGALINVVKHLGNLKFKVWEKMQEIVQYSPVILDPNTADASLLVSDDLTSLHDASRDFELPENPERFSDQNRVLGSEGFRSGVHSWTVAVEGNDSWEVGVMEESAHRKGFDEDGDEDEHGFLNLCQYDEKVICLGYDPKMVRVTLDLDVGKLSFFDAENSIHIQTLKHNFSEKVYPCFYTCSDAPLRVLPQKFFITVQPGTWKRV